MAKIFTCRMTKTITFDMKADSLSQAHDWCATHDFQDVQHESSYWDIDYYESVGEIKDDGYIAIDISED